MTTVKAPSRRPRATRTSDHRFYIAMAIAAVIVVVVGFGPSYYFRSRFVPSPLDFYLHVHGLVFSSWIVLFVAQVTLVSVRRTDVHRRLGWLGAGLACLVVIAGTTAGILSGQRAVAAGFEDESRTFLTTPLFSMIAFGILVAAAVYVRRQTEVHKRLMLLATISILDAPLARWPGGLTTMQTYLVIGLFIVAGVLYDFASKRRLSPAYLWGGLLIAIGLWLRDVVSATETWHAFARSVIG